MAFCTDCGAIYPWDDRDLHVCDPADVPQKGETIRFSKRVV